MMKNSTIEGMLFSLSSPTRQIILQRLSHGPTTISILAETLQISLPAINRHIAQLEDSGLVVREKMGRDNYLAIDQAGLRTIEQWMRVTCSSWLRSIDAYTKYIGQK